MTAPTVRERFERWHYRNVGFDVSCWRAPSGGGYAHAQVQWRWEAWTAAFKAGRDLGREEAERRAREEVL